MQGAGRRQKAALGIFGVKTRFHRMAADHHILLCHGQGFACGNAQLQRHQIKARNGLGHRMLDLQPRIHFHEIKAVSPQTLGPIHDEFDGARPHIAHSPRGLDRSPPHCLTHVIYHARCGSLLDDFLMAALQGTIALKQMQHMAVLIGKNLHLDMARGGDIALDQNPRIPKRGLPLPLGRSQSGSEILPPLHFTHALAAAARHRFDQHGIADALGLALQKIRLLPRTVITGHDRHTGFFHQSLGCIFQAHGPNGCGGWAYKNQTRLGHRIGEISIFRQKSVARMNGLCAACQSGCNDFVAA